MGSIPVHGYLRGGQLKWRGGLRSLRWRNVSEKWQGGPLTGGTVTPTNRERLGGKAASIYFPSGEPTPLRTTLACGDSDHSAAAPIKVWG